MQAIWECGPRPPTDGPIGRALCSSRAWGPWEGSWCWGVPRQTKPLHMVQEPIRAVQHCVHEALRCHAARQLEARWPATFRGLGDGVDGAACHSALQVASNEKEAFLLCGLLAGALWTSARVCGLGLRMPSTCPFCGATHEDTTHVLWDCPWWRGARGSWSPWLLAAAVDLPHLNPPKHWPACLRRVGLLPSSLSEGLDKAPVDTFLYRLYGVYLAVLAERMAACHDGHDGPGCGLFP